MATTFSEKTVASLPILNRRFTAFELLTPGVQATTSQTASSEDPQGSYRKVVNGQSFAGSSHLLDGTDNHDALLGLIVINPTLESLTEAKITTANYDAEFGATAGVISAQTKSGTNDLRGAPRISCATTPSWRATPSHIQPCDRYGIADRDLALRQQIRLSFGQRGANVIVLGPALQLASATGFAQDRSLAVKSTSFSSARKLTTNDGGTNTWNSHAPYTRRATEPASVHPP